MKNKLTDLNNHLFTQLERLNDEDIKGDALKEEIHRAKAITSISKNIIDNAKTMLEGAKFAYKYSSAENKLPELFEGKKEK